jgi:hypothetical protein
VKDPPKIAVLPGHLQALIDDEVVMVKQAHEFQRRLSGGAAISGSGRRGEEAQPELKKSKKKKKKKRDRDDADGTPAKAGKPASRGTAAGGTGESVDRTTASQWRSGTLSSQVLTATARAPSLRSMGSKTCSCYSSWSRGFEASWRHDPTRLLSAGARGSGVSSAPCLAGGAALSHGPGTESP